MFRFLLITFFASVLSLAAVAQTDTVTKPPLQPAIANQVDTTQKDSVHSVQSAMDLLMQDSVCEKPVHRDSLWSYQPSFPWTWQVEQFHPYFDFKAKATRIEIKRRQYEEKDTLFYVLIALAMLFALLRLAFMKYVNDIFRLFFRTTLKQRQVRDQLIQTPLASLLFNGFFVATAGLYIDLLFVYTGRAPADFWLLYFYCAAGLSVIYFVKYLGLKITGWILNVKEAADSYIFIVFIVNKVIGIFLLPFVWLLSFTDGLVYSTSMLLSWVGLGILYCYRFILAYSSLRNQVRFNLFHFLLYFCAFEVAPLLLIYRLLLVFVQ